MAGRRVSEKPHRADPLTKGPPAPKNKGGRPTKQQAAEKAQEVLATQRMMWQQEAKANLPILREVVAIPFDMAARRRGKHWKLAADERDRIALAVGTLVAKWLPDVAKQYQEELACGLLLGAAVVGRVRADMAAKEKAAKKPPVPQPDGKMHGAQDELLSTLDNGDAAHGEDHPTAAVAQSLAG